MTKGLGDSISTYAFGRGGAGGNPCTVYKGDHLHAGDMQRLASEHGHECCFVLRPSTSRGFDIRLRFFAPAEEMEMCGHATLVAAWLEMELCGVKSLMIETPSAPVEAMRGEGRTWISQAAGWAAPVDAAPALEALGLSADDLDRTRPVLNAASTRSKTMVPLRSRLRLDELAPESDAVAAACAAVGSTGLYPYVPEPDGTIYARQFPSGAGYVEDPATGLAAAALFEALGRPQGEFVVRQGDAMGRPSEIFVRPHETGIGCWIGGGVRVVPSGEAVVTL